MASPYLMRLAAPPDEESPYTRPMGRGSSGATIGDILASRGSVPAPDWGAALANVGQILGQGIMKAKAEKDEKAVGTAVADAMKNPTGFDMEAIQKSVPPELLPRVMKGIQDADNAASMIDERRMRTQQLHMEIQKLEQQQQQDVLDYGGTVAYHTKPFLEGPDGGLGALTLAYQHAVARKVPGVEAFGQHLEEAHAAMQQAQASGDPAAVKAAADQVRGQFGPLLDQMMLGMSPTGREKLTTEAGKLISVKEGERLIDPITHKVVAEGDPKDVNLQHVETADGIRSFDPKTGQLGPVIAKGASQAADAAVALTPAGLDAAARQYAQTGQLPPMGMGKASAGARTRIINRAAELFPDLDVAGNKAAFGADEGALKTLQKQRDSIGAFESTASRNIDIFLKEAGKVVDTGSPLANSLARQVSGKLLGSEDQAGYDAARQVAINEIAKITSNPTLAGQLSDTARKEVEFFNPRDATLAQTVRVMRLLKQDMENRRTALDDQIGQVKGRIHGRSGAGAGASASAGTAKKANPFR